MTHAFLNFTSTENFPLHFRGQELEFSADLNGCINAENYCLYATQGPGKRAIKSMSNVEDSIECVALVARKVVPNLNVPSSNPGSGILGSTLHYSNSYTPPICHSAPTFSLIFDLAPKISTISLKPPKLSKNYNLAP
ncbi:hypothetical protein VNO77_04271 [Canavalia gladiata]|uniref:Uncharacterized protein n=1 Tax=Canavalia gladiata TaxID=3824 RepID=A0AAN9N1D5_CANGL